MEYFWVIILGSIIGAINFFSLSFEEKNILASLCFIGIVTSLIMDYVSRAFGLGGPYDISGFLFILVGTEMLVYILAYIWKKNKKES